MPGIVVRDFVMTQADRAAVGRRVLDGRERSLRDALPSLLPSASREIWGLAFDEFRGTAADKVIPVGTLPMGQAVWFVGDVHGDLLGLESALFAIERLSAGDLTPPVVVFLGDLIDRESDSLAVLVRVLQMIKSQPKRVCFLSGNHDESLVHELVSGRFTSGVVPAEFAQWLNRPEQGHRAGVLGQLLVRLAHGAPRALFFQEGLMAAHGGFPHTDLHPTLSRIEDLSRPACVQDFVWNRATRYPAKRPNRVSKGCQFGYRDFQAFCKVAGAILGHPVTTLVRGHDHAEGPDRLCLHPEFGGGLITINTMGHCLAGETWEGALASGTYLRNPCVLRYRPDENPELWRVMVGDEDFVRRFYPAASPASDDESWGAEEEPSKAAGTGPAH